jgi:RNA polymerase sigma-70 factor (ECF subfamily)
MQPEEAFACTKERVDPDIQKMLRLGQRDRAFERILDLYQNKVIRLIYTLVGNIAIAEDIAQDALLKVWQALDIYDGRAALGTWIYTIARNTALTHLRAETYRRTLPLDAVAEPAATSAAEPGPDIRKHVERLPEEQREAIVLYYFQEKSVEDVAQMLDLPIGTVKSQLFRARKTLAEKLNGAKTR